jgi:[ribosomal protein S5]-alanine N-acetyltransferase
MVELNHTYMPAGGPRRLALYRIWAACDVDNHGSARVLGKLGMRREGLLRQSRRRQGEWRDSYLYAIFEPDGRDRSRPA